MSDELRAVASAVLEPFDHCWPTAEFVDSARLIAHAYLAERPADDAEPVTEEWLRAMGFLPDGDDPALQEFSIKIWDLGEHTDYGTHPAMHFTVSMIDLSAWLEAYGTDGKSLCLIELPPKKTRGHVRRLAAALGIALKDSA